MITQVFKNGKNEIKFENAESIEDAKKNGFPEGVSVRYFINNKPVHNYMALVKYIIEETKKTGNKFIPPSKNELKNLQKQVIQKQNNEIRKNMLELKSKYRASGVPENILKQMDDAINKIDVMGIRVVE